MIAPSLLGCTVAAKPQDNDSSLKAHAKTLCCDGQEHCGMQTYQLKLWTTPVGVGMVYQSWRREQVSAYKRAACKGHSWKWPG